jgi:hypothetical protein
VIVKEGNSQVKPPGNAPVENSEEGLDTIANDLNVDITFV